MKKPSSQSTSQEKLREKLLGFGEDSLRKSYYPELQRHLGDLQEQVELAKLVANVTRGLAEEKDLRLALQRCTDSLVLHTDAVFARIWITDRNEEFLVLQASSGLHTNLDGQHSHIDIKNFPYKIGTIARSQKPLLSNQVVGDPNIHDQEWVKQKGIVSFAGYPINLDNRLVGVVAIFANRPFQPVTLDTISTIISQIAVGIKRKRAEIELADYKDKLEQLVQERTQQLEEAQAELLQSERLATLGRLTATVSHELRNPLGTIQTAIFTIDDSLERNDFNQTKRALELAERNILRCVKIIEDLTDYTRVKKLNMVETEVDEWLAITIDEIEIPENIQLVKDLNCGSTANFDNEKLRQVIVNLVNNAVDALGESASREKVLKISSRRLDDHFEIIVSDTGIGMSAETLLEVFTPLFSTKGFGVGLGMVIVKNIVERHSGTISIDSDTGRGTTITLHLPVDLT